MNSEKFLKYCKTHKTLVRPNKNFVVSLGGGMAVKLYLTARGVDPLPKKVASTTDFDFTFAVSHPLTDAGVDKYSLEMYHIMYNFMKGFIRPDQLRIKSYPRKSHIPATGKKTYHVIQFKDSKGEDFVDCTLAYIPGTSRANINTPVSMKFGLPIKKLKYMYKDVLVVLAGSFIYKKILPRNPLGKKPEKGRRDTARVSALQKLKVSSPKTIKTSEFLKAIRAKDKKTALTKARGIIDKVRQTTKKLLDNLR
jgi:hypothetical protein